MKGAPVRRLVACALLAAAGSAASQQPATPAPSPARPAEPERDRPRLNLKLDDSGAFRPRITFSPHDAGEQRAADGLPSLGAGASKAFDQPERSRTPASGPSVFPKDSEAAR